MYKFGGIHFSQNKSLLKMDCSISFHQSCLKHLPGACGTKERMTGFSFLLLGSLIPSHCFRPVHYRPKDPWEGQPCHQLRSRQEEEETEGEGERRREKERLKKKKGEGQRVKALMSSAGRGLPAFVSRIRDSNPTQFGRPTREPDQSYITYELGGLGSAIYTLDISAHSFIVWFIHLFVH